MTVIKTTFSFEKIEGSWSCIDTVVSSDKSKILNIALETLNQIYLSDWVDTLKITMDKGHIISITSPQELENKTIKIIKKAFQSRFAYNKEVAKTTSKKSEIHENSIKKSVVNGADSFFRKRIIHAKAADIATLLLFGNYCNMYNYYSYWLCRYI